MKYNASE